MKRYQRQRAEFGAGVKGVEHVIHAAAVPENACRGEDLSRLVQAGKQAAGIVRQNGFPQREKLFLGIGRDPTALLIGLLEKCPVFLYGDLLRHLILGLQETGLPPHIVGQRFQKVFRGNRDIGIVAGLLEAMPVKSLTILEPGVKSDLEFIIIRQLGENVRYDLVSYASRAPGLLFFPV